MTCSRLVIVGYDMKDLTGAEKMTGNQLRLSNGTKQTKERVKEVKRKPTSKKTRKNSINPWRQSEEYTSSLWGERFLKRVLFRLGMKDESGMMDGENNEDEYDELTCASIGKRLIRMRPTKWINITRLSITFISFASCMRVSMKTLTESVPVFQRYRNNTQPTVRASIGYNST